MSNMSLNELIWTYAAKIIFQCNYNSTGKHSPNNLLGLKEQCIRDCKDAAAAAIWDEAAKIANTAVFGDLHE